jgi:hypothetical protein
MYLAEINFAQKYWPTDVGLTEASSVSVTGQTENKGKLRGSYRAINVGLEGRCRPKFEILTCLH